MTGHTDNDNFINICNSVFDSKTPNYRGRRLSILNNINILYLDYMLKDYEDKQIIEFLNYGWPINFSGVIEKQTKLVYNHKGATEYQTLIDKYIKQELLSGATIGPFDCNPLNRDLFISPLNSVPKKDSLDRRVILDLSYPRNRSVNDSIPKGEYLGVDIELSYPSVDDLAQLIRSLGKGCLLYKRDLRKAYRQIPIDPGDIHLLAYTWENKIYIDRNAPMGLRTAALMCQRLTSAISYIHYKCGFQCVNYVDDLAGAAPSEFAQEAFQNLGNIIRDAGLKESGEKACPPSVCMEFLGIEFDTLKMECRISSQRLLEIKELLNKWLGKKSATKVQLQSLIGSLQFIGKCVAPGRVFIGRMLETLRKLKCQYHKFKLKCEFKKDLLWWQRFLCKYNGISIIPEQLWCKPDKVLSTDACLEGCGGVCENEYFHVMYPEEIKRQKLSINALEMLTVTVALKLWSKNLHGKRLLIYCDNLMCVNAINTGKVKDSFLLLNLREQRFLCAVHEYELKAVHLPGCENRLPDSLSRWSLSDKYKNIFYDLTKNMNMKEVFVDKNVFKLNNNY